MSTNDNANVKPPTAQVDEEATRLAGKFNNSGWEPFYCKAIYSLGIRRVREIEGRVADAKYPGKLFTKLVKEELKVLEGKRRMKPYGHKKER